MNRSTNFQTRKRVHASRHNLKEKGAKQMAIAAEYKIGNTKIIINDEFLIVYKSCVEYNNYYNII